MKVTGNVSIDTALQDFHNEIFWLRQLLNQDLKVENVDEFAELFESALAEKPLEPALANSILGLVGSILGGINEMLLFSKLSRDDRARLQKILVLFINSAKVLERKDLEDRILKTHSFLEETYSLQETLGIIQSLARRLAPLLVHSDSSSDLNQLFLERIDNYYSGLNDSSLIK